MSDMHEIERYVPVEEESEYQTYLREFFAHHPNAPVKDANTCWNYKKTQPGKHCYEKEDLEVLVMK